MKYMIKNCDCFYLNACYATNTDRFYCKDIADCLLKRIVGKCYKATHEDLVITDDYNKTACEVAEIYGRASLADEILKLLEIEECENE